MFNSYKIPIIARYNVPLNEKTAREFIGILELTSCHIMKSLLNRFFCSNMFFSNFRYGAGRCGLMCAIASLVDMINVEQEVDMFNIVKQIQLASPRFISNMVRRINY